MTLLINRLFNSKYRHIKKKIKIKIKKKPGFAVWAKLGLNSTMCKIYYFTNLEVWSEPSV